MFTDEKRMEAIKYFHIFKVYYGLANLYKVVIYLIKMFRKHVQQLFLKKRLLLDLPTFHTRPKRHNFGYYI